MTGMTYRAVASDRWTLTSKLVIIDPVKAVYHYETERLRPGEQGDEVQVAAPTC